MASALSENKSPINNKSSEDLFKNVLKIHLMISPRITDLNRKIYQISRIEKAKTDYKTAKIYESYVWRGTLASTMGLLSIFETTFSLKFETIRGELFLNAHSKFSALSEKERVLLHCLQSPSSKTFDVPTKEVRKRESGKRFFNRKSSETLKEFMVYQRHYLPIYEIILVVPETFEKNLLSDLYNHLLNNFDYEYENKR